MKKNIIVISLLFFGLIYSFSYGQSINRLGPNYFIAGIPTQEFEIFSSAKVYGKQRQANWCWAASIQMVLNYHGLYVKQEQIVERIYGGLVDRPANQQQILNALSGWAFNVSGGKSNIYARPGINNPNEITQQLAYKWPLIVGLEMPNNSIGHAYVLTAIYYSVDQNNNTIPKKVVLRDPMPGYPSRQELSWNDFQKRLFMIIRVGVSR